MSGYFLKTIKGGNKKKIKILCAKIIDNLAKSLNIIVVNYYIVVIYSL